MLEQNNQMKTVMVLDCQTVMLQLKAAFLSQFILTFSYESTQQMVIHAVEVSHLLI